MWDEELSRKFMQYGRFFVPEREFQMRTLFSLFAAPIYHDRLQKATEFIYHFNKNRVESLYSQEILCERSVLLCSLRNE